MKIRPNEQTARMHYNLQRWMIGLDMTETDEQLIAYTAFLARHLQPEALYFVHSPDDLEVPEAVRKELYQTDQPLDEYFKSQMQEKVAKYFDSEATEHEIAYKVTEGSPLPALLHWSQVKDVDLILVGRKQTLKGSGVIPKRLARRSACSILFVPETFPIQLREIIVGVDFSENSQRALGQALSLAEQVENCGVLVHNVYEVPQGYHTSGKSFEEFGEIMKGHARKRYDTFIKKVDTREVRVQPAFALSQEKKPAQTFCKSAVEHEADLMLITSRGRTRFAALLLGSFAESMVMEDAQVPMLILKNKNKNMGVLDALLNV